jgi:hypothetical protein
MDFSRLIGFIVGFALLAGIVYIWYQVEILGVNLFR